MSQERNTQFGPENADCSDDSENEMTIDTEGQDEYLSQESSSSSLASSQDSHNDSGLSSSQSSLDERTYRSFSDDSGIIPKQESPADSTSSSTHELQKFMPPSTPARCKTEVDDPLSPTANLKVLFSAISPEIRVRDKKLAEASKDEEELKPKKATTGRKSTARKKLEVQMEAAEDDEDASAASGPSRKDKSLGLLCQRFLAKYPECPSTYERIEISLDQVAKELKVERRRIYDIVNVLESVEMVSRLAKNCYTWHGKTSIKHTLSKLQMLARQEGLDHYLERLKEKENNTRASPVSPVDPKFICPIKENGKEKSLGIMSQRFLMLFLVSQNQTVNLDSAAKILIGDGTHECSQDAKFKTKIRRLYDIANILTSLDLIEKIHVQDSRGRKPAFRYTGPDISCNHQHADKFGMCYTDGCHRPPSRHSLFHCGKNPKLHHLLSQPGAGETERTDNKRAITRHASFEQICEVAEVERNRLYFGTETTSSRTLFPRVERKEERSFADAMTQSSPGESTESRKPTQVHVVHKASGMQILRVRSMPSSMTYRANSPAERTSIKRATPDSSQDAPGSECYFDAKRPRREEKIDLELDNNIVKPSPSIPPQIVRLKTAQGRVQPPQSVGNFPVHLVSPIHIIRAPVKIPTSSSNVRESPKPTTSASGLLQPTPRGAIRSKMTGRPVIRTMSTPVSSGSMVTGISLLSPQTMVSPIQVNGNRFTITPQLKSVRGVNPSNAIINLIPQLEQPTGQANSKTFVRHLSTDSVPIPVVSKSTFAYQSMAPSKYVVSRSEPVCVLEMSELLSPNSFFRNTPGSMNPGQSLIPPLTHSSTSPFKLVRPKNTVVPEHSTTARKLKLCQDPV